MPAILQVAPPSPRGSLPIPNWSRSSLVTCTNGLPTASAVTRRPCPYRPDPRGPASGGGKQEGNPGRRLISVPQLWGDPGFKSVVQHDPVERRTIPNGTEPRQQ